MAHRLGGARGGHSSALLSEIDAVLREAGVSVRDIELFAVACGPGSFTGLRAGLATVKAFATIRRAPITPVPTLHAVAASAGPSAATVAAIPAGRGEVFAQLLSVREDLRVTELSEPVHVQPQTLVRMAHNWYFDLLTWTGEGAHLNRELILEAAASRTASTGGNGDRGGAEEPRAWRLTESRMTNLESITRLGLISFGGGSFVASEELGAIYVRPSDAELGERRG